jgi:hypothetical protein
MPRRGRTGLFSAALGLILATALTASAQITTGTITGTVLDSTGGTVPGATVILINEAQGTKSAPQVTNNNGSYTFPYMASGTYTVQVTMDGFKESDRKGVALAGGASVKVPNVTLSAAGVSASVDVVANVAILQAASGERSDVIQGQQLESLPVANRGFRDLVNLLPGVNPGGQSAQQGRIGGGGQDNVMIDGISILDTGNNGLMGGVANGNNLNLPVDSIAEVRLETSGYQAEFGRSSGLQISAITKSGTNRFHGSMYDIENNSRWNQNSFTNISNGNQKGRSSSHQWGYTIGGPVGKPGGNNKLFFFYAQQFTPGTSGGNTNNLRVPTLAERRGDFSQTRDQSANPLAVTIGGVTKTYLYDATLGPKSGCTAPAANATALTPTTTCFGNGSGILPTSRLYGPTVAWLNSYPAPTCSLGEDPSLQACPTGQNFNYSSVAPIQHPLSWVPTIRGDYQITPGLRVSAKGTFNSNRVLPNLGSIPGYTDQLGAFPHVYNVSGTVNYSLNPTTFVEATYGYVQNQLGTPAVSPYSNRKNITCANEAGNTLPFTGTWGGADVSQIPGGAAACNLDAIFFPLGTAGQVMNKGYYEFGGNVATGSPFLDPNTAAITLPPTLSFNSANGATSRLPGTVPSIGYPGYMNINRNQNLSVSVTKVMGRHTAKAGFLVDHSYKAQNQQNGPSFQGGLNFGDDGSNPLETGYPFANEILGIYQSYSQSSQFIEGSFLYTSVEPYIQDNWKVNRKLTLDYGMRFVHQGPQYDQFQAQSTFYFNKWSLASAPKLFQPGCVGGAISCTGNNRQALNPVTGQLQGAGTANLIGAAIPGSGDFANGMRVAGTDGTPNTAMTWPSVAFAPRFGAAYDVNGNQKLVLRGSIGLFYDRPEGNSVFSSVANPPQASSITQQWSTLQAANSGVSSGPVSLIQDFEPSSKLPSDTQWNFGAQAALPWSSSVGVSYVGHHGYNLLTNQSCGTCFTDINSIDLGVTLPAGTALVDGVVSNGQGIDPTTGGAKTTNLIRPIQGYSAIRIQEAKYYRTFHSIQSDFTRRFRDGVSFGVAYTLTLSDHGNVGIIGSSPQTRFVHAGTAEGIAQGLSAVSDGTFAVNTNPISGQAAAEKVFLDQGVTRHIVQTNFVWAIPKWNPDGGAMRAISYVINDWQLSGIFRFSSGSPYDLNTPSYSSGPSGQALTGTPDISPRIVINDLGAIGSGCTSNQYSQFANNFASTNYLLSSATPFSGPVVGSVGLDSGRNTLHNCKNRTLDLSLSRTIRLGGGRQFQIRADAFNAPNAQIITGSNRTVSVASAANQTQNTSNRQLLADGTPDPAALKANQARFGAVNNWAQERRVQLQVRFIF